MPILSLNDVSLAYERQRGFTRSTGNIVLDRVSLELAAGEFVAVIGRSGSGKTSLLNLAAGLLRPTSGRVTVDGREVTAPGADRAVVFQDDALFPWLNVRDNVGFPLKLKGTPSAERYARAEELLGRVGLAGFGDRHIWELSGGQRQRVGLARALSARPPFLLMDEALGALDAMTREQVQELLLELWDTSHVGVLLITHSVEEALFLATRVIVLAPDPGRVVLDMPADFGRRVVDGAAPRKVKADPEFIAAREALLDAIHDVQVAA